ncbi:hypothetical protein DEJ48_20350 [Streptomyces venezuelae]|uniref:Uncharacterized protein n=1 Tax=Streptomyces venezuelae TaxID=54571 RepID=A0A5P2BZ07_STRVZ|nr:hypothetical protein [Streptomyces venezuelae]QES35467.1 hypothetical protein DEJ48_20350 [Streptomyces venezuelae]
MLRFYGLDLLDWHRGRLSSRRLAVLIRQLPREGAVARETEGEAAEWSVGDYLLAHAVDQLAQANWMFATVNQDEDADPLDPPQPIPRPDADALPDAGVEQLPEPADPKPTAEQLAAFFV